jgi:hypothetical protein
VNDRNIEIINSWMDHIHKGFVLVHTGIAFIMVAQIAILFILIFGRN